MYFHLHRSQNDSLKFLDCIYVQDYIAAVQVRLTRNQQNTRATNLCWRIAFCKAYRLPSSYPSFPLFWALPSVDKNQNIPTLLTWHFQDNDRSPTRPFQPPCWTRQQHVSEADLREDPKN